MGDPLALLIFASAALLTAIFARNVGMRAGDALISCAVYTIVLIALLSFVQLLRGG